MSIWRRIPREEDDAAVWRIDVPMMTNCGAPAPSEIRDAEWLVSPDAVATLPRGLNRIQRPNTGLWERREVLSRKALANRERGK
jgi:hypothetical protein